MEKEAIPTKFHELPEETKAFLCELDAHDLILLTKCMELVRTLALLGKFGKWIVLTSISVFVFMVTFGDALIKALSILTEWRKHRGG